MPRLAASASEIDADMSEAHEGSASPNARKRKKVRRRSIETNNVGTYTEADGMVELSSQCPAILWNY